MQPSRALSIVFAVCLGTSMPALGAVMYVDDSATAGLNDGTSWENAFLDLQSALAIANKGDKVHIGAGTYKPSSTGDRAATFKLPKRVVVRGGFAGFGADDPDAWDPAAYVAILSGDLNGDDTVAGENTQENSYHVVTLDGVDRRAKLRGVTVAHGNASEFLSNPSSNGAGGGMILLNKASPTIADCRFLSNKAIHAGGAVHAGAGSSLFKKCGFEKNEAGMNTPVAGIGGAVACGGTTAFHDCTFTSNHASMGGGAVSGPGSYFSCAFVDNNSGEEAGGALSGAALAVDSTFIDNRAGWYGGAISGISKVVNCRFFSNKSGGQQGGGGAVSGVGLAVNCLFSGNSSPLISAVSASSASASKFVNCTFIGNSITPQSPPNQSVEACVAGAADLSNCVFWNNTDGETASELSQVSGAATISNCCIMGWTGALGGSGNSGDDPLFIDADGTDDVYGTEDDNPRLSSASTCIDAGQNVLLPKDKFDLDADENVNERTSLDLDLTARKVNGIVDIGAFESPEGGYPPAMPGGCPADIAPASEAPAPAGDGSVGENDLLAMIGVWGACDGCVADLNADGTVGVDDLLLLVAAWGECQ